MTSRMRATPGGADDRPPKCQRDVPRTFDSGGTNKKALQPEDCAHARVPPRGSAQAHECVADDTAVGVAGLSAT
jgi:hypothetical protein